jgi:hypothetical protein
VSHMRRQKLGQRPLQKGSGFVVNSEPHTGARTSVRLRVGLIIDLAKWAPQIAKNFKLRPKLHLPVCLQLLRLCRLNLDFQLKTPAKL